MSRSSESPSGGPSPDRFLAAAGPVPARGADARWRQVALLSASSAMGDPARAATSLAAVLAALDRPRAARVALAQAAGDDPWAIWWGVLTAGQEGDLDGFAEARRAAAAGDVAGPDAREVRRRLADLETEIAALAGDPGGAGARFSVLGHRARPERRMLIGGRSSAVYLVDPGWDAVRLVRLGPPEGTAVGNRALLAPEELIAAVRRGDAGPGWDVPDDAPPALDPDTLLGALREDVDVRDRRLVALAREVAEERERLREDRVRLAEDREAFELECASERMRRSRAAGTAPPAGGAVGIPRTARDALALLALPAGATPAQVERAWRRQVVRCHPDRVVDLHPDIQGRAQGLTVALNAARDLLLGAAPTRVRG
ncbi:MAG: hypothetical protein ACLGG9_05920 [Thermoleophilia bacterium]|jgi:DnaJ-domain-containing protein 1